MSIYPKSRKKKGKLTKSESENAKNKNMPRIMNIKSKYRD